MATWTEIPNSSIETGRPIRAIDGRALRDNPVAIAEGAGGAPRVVNAALDGGITWNKMAGVTVGNVICCASGYSRAQTLGIESISHSATAFDSARSPVAFHVHKTGTLRIRFRRGNTGTGTASFRVYRQRPSGTAITQGATNVTEYVTSSASINTTTSTGGPTNTSVDVAVQQGDIVYINLQTNAGGTEPRLDSVTISASSLDFIVSEVNR